MATLKSNPAKHTIMSAFGSVKELDKAIAAVIDASKGLQDNIQAVAVGIMVHCYKHGDFTRAQTLVDGLGQGVRRAALVEWFHACGLKVDEKEQRFNGFNKAKMEDKFEKLKSTPWYTLKPERPFMGFDMQAELERLIKKAERAMKTAADTPDLDAALMKVTPDQIKSLRSLAGITLQ